MWKQVSHVAWWLGVSFYFGGMVALGIIVAPAVFASAHQNAMTMQAIASPPLDMSRQVGGEIFGVILQRFGWVELASLALMALGLLPLLIHWPVRRSTCVLLALWIALAAVAGFDATVLRPHVWATRTELRSTALAHTSETQPWPERDAFDRLHLQSETLGRVKVYLLFAMLLVAAARGIAEPSRPHKKTSAPLPAVE